jgi:hypothetical protein
MNRAIAISLSVLLTSFYLTNLARALLANFSWMQLFPVSCATAVLLFLPLTSFHLTNLAQGLLANFSRMQLFPMNRAIATSW